MKIVGGEMDELKPENQSQGQNDLRPDTSDRPTGRPRQPASKQKPKLTVSRQHIMIGVGVLVLLLLIIAISSALKAPTEHEKQQANTTTERNIDLSSSSSLANNPTQGQPQEVTMPPISGTPTQNQLPSQRQDLGERVEIPGDVADALHQGQNLPVVNQQQTLPPQVVQPVTPAVTPKTTQPVKSTKTDTKPQTITEKKPVTPAKQATSSINGGQGGKLMAAPVTNYTLQLSSASRSDTLNAFAKQNKLTDYTVYKTVRNGQTWYVLIHGNYRSVNEAKNAIATLPSAVQAKKPWVRNMKQVQQDQKK
ncbi:inner membrane bile resistance protein [Moellerella wisconsensis ATCC 35017]|uniref:Cell division protein DamX n=2 Tax=Moellerella wisconsensis TaxID=158849 RepID=A0A0N1KIT7_9GAMM|nr:inner membrane bile resistance protein [Moellerella wisconsensis ATCC 35017]VFS50019.1 Uncharacterized protein conserved in bacteria [Moellerella wisconsensis]